MVLGDDFQPSLSDGISRLFAHVAAVHVPLWLHQRLHDVFGTTDGVEAEYRTKDVFKNK